MSYTLSRMLKWKSKLIRCISIGSLENLWNVENKLPLPYLPDKINRVEPLDLFGCE